MKKQLPKTIAFSSLLAGVGLGLLVLLAPPAFAAPPRTTTVWTTSTQDGVGVIPYVRVDKKALFVDFEGFDTGALAGNIEYIYYNLNYTNKNTGVAGGVEGSFLATKDQIYGSYGGKNYARRELVFGTCSKNVCDYHKPKDVKLTVNTKLKTGKIAQYTRVIKISDDQF